MTSQPSSAPARPALFDRVRNILLQPRAEWDRIASESAELRRLYLGYVLPLAATAALVVLAGSLIAGFTLSFFVDALVFVVGSVAGVFVLALIVNGLAPTFGAKRDLKQAHKLVVYSSTAAIIAYAFNFVDALAILSLVGLYSFVLLYIGLPRLMKPPEERRFLYFGAIVVSALVLGLLAMYVRQTTWALGNAAYETPQETGASTEARVTYPGGSMNLSDVDKLAREAQKSATVTATATTAPAMDPTRLEPFLPASIAGYTRTSISTAAAGNWGAGAVEADGLYERGEARFTLQIVHFVNPGPYSELARQGVQTAHEDADGYSRTHVVNNRIVMEELSRSQHTAKYQIIGRGISITAQGTGISGDQARMAAQAVDIAAAEALGA